MCSRHQFITLRSESSISLYITALPCACAASPVSVAFPCEMQSVRNHLLLGPMLTKSHGSPMLLHTLPQGMVDKAQHDLDWKDAVAI